MNSKIVRRAFALATAASAGLLIASGGAAFASAASPINGPAYTKIESGYEIQASSVRFNDERANLCVAPGASTSVGVGLQDNVNGGETVVLALVNEPASVNGPAGYYLETGHANETNAVTGTPFANGSLSSLKTQFSLSQVATLGAPIGTPLFTSITGGCYFTEVRQSTRLSRINFIAGPTENNTAVLSRIFGGIGTDFNAPFVGALNATGNNLPISHAEVTVSRNGVTEPSGVNVKTIGGARVTFDAFALDETEATNSGTAPTIANPLTLINNPALPGTGSAFGITTGS
jgi:hypothetical protein